MDEFIANIKNIVTPEILVYIIIATVLLVILTIVMIMLRQKKAKKELDELELKYNSLKSIPLSFKLNKAVALSRVNQEMAQRVEVCKNDFDLVSEKLKECSVMLAEIDDLVYVRKTKAANRKMSTLVTMLNQCEENANHVNEALDEVLEKESEQREQINKLKEEFRNVKRKINDNRTSYHQANEYLEREISAIEKMFSLFEEWMFASEFSKAADQQQEILETIHRLEALLESLPALYERAKGVLPRVIDEVGYNYSQCKNKGVYLEHLEITKNLELISDMLKEDLNKLRNGQIDNIEEDLDECEKRLTQLQEQIDKEEKAFEEVNKNVDILYESIRAVNQDVETIEKLYNRVYERFGFENWTDKLKETSERLSALNEMKRRLEKIILEKTIPYTTVLITYKELDQSNTIFMDEVAKMKVKLETACSDEERAKKQLVKLQLIVNEIHVKMKKHRLPSVSQKYQEDLHRAKVMIKEISCILDNTPLDVKRMNAELKNAIDYIYTLYNSVNNLVGMANMVENTIVFGNRYRSSYPDIDSELTRCELCFRNGQYTKALKIGIQAIEKMHPGAYENLISKKDPSIMNQVE
ncbi:MAG: septation ring formation regulator EzrA [Erysipelotrichaceae bacterium]|nr:septation ring formation regulator EzrA [Erysipelotrichaceae bacterium]MCI9523905.1 septation ring formation regulator EzrA [Erysipelotrichaceae bacterium]